MQKIRKTSSGYKIGDYKATIEGRNITFKPVNGSSKTFIIPVNGYPVVTTYIKECVSRNKESDVSPTELSLYYSGYTENGQKTIFRLYNTGHLGISNKTDNGILIYDKDIPSFLSMLEENGYGKKFES